MRIIAACILVLTFACGTAAAQTVDADTTRALGEVAGELQVCSVYFGIASRCIKPQRPDIAITYQRASDKLAESALSNERSVGVSDKAFVAQDRLYTEAMLKAMGSCTNIAVLLEKYSDFCKRLSEDADLRLKEWIACARAHRETCSGGPTLP